jgi:carboxyl-terminal processing protease
MGGSGTLPDAAPAAEAPARDEVLDVCIVGGGPAGLAAARAVAEASPGARVAVYDEQPLPGGSLLAEVGGAARGRALADAARAAGARVVQNATGIAYYPEDRGSGGEAGVLAVATPDSLLRVQARRTLYATGAYDQNLPFPNNDRPEVVSARACGRLAFLWGVRPVSPKRKVVILGDAPTAPALADGLAGAGIAAARAAGPVPRRRAGDLLAVAAIPAPASELPRQHGARVAFDEARGGFAVAVDDRHATGVEGVFACGDVTGYVGPAAAQAAGAAAGRAVVDSLRAAGGLVALLVTLGLSFAISGCAAPATPPPATPQSEAAPAGPPAAVQPPPFAPQAPKEPAVLADVRASQRRAILDAVWKTVRDKHYDPTLGGLDWNATRARYEPLALGAPSEAAFYRVLNQMIGELGQSHMMVTGPGAEDADDIEDLAPPGEGPAMPSGPKPAPGAIGDPGITVRIIEGRPTVTRVRDGSSADRAGLRPGFIVTEIAGRPLGSPRDSARPLRPVEERFELRRAATRRLMGAPGTRVSITYLDDKEKPGKVVLVREEPRTTAVHLGHLPPLYPEVRAYEVGDVGVVAFNIFLVQPVLADLKQAVARFAAHHVRAIVLDLRGNPGGQGAMAIPVGSLFVKEPVTLGTLKFRDFGQTLVARPEMGAVPFLGPLAILTDEGTASAAEILAAGLQESKRAVVVGDASLGAVLPSVIEALPGGAVMQYVVADFKTPKGVLLEGRGVQPDKRVLETRSALRSGRDPVLDAALVAVRASSKSQNP